MLDFIEDHLFATFFTGLLMLLGGVIFGADMMARRSCGIYQHTTGHPTRYFAFDTCYVQREGKWYRWDEYKLAFATAAEE